MEQKLLLLRAPGGFTGDKRLDESDVFVFHEDCFVSVVFDDPVEHLFGAIFVFPGAVAVGGSLLVEEGVALVGVGDGGAYCVGKRRGHG